jgi:hypothetical protein
MCAVIVFVVNVSNFLILKKSILIKFIFLNIKEQEKKTIKMNYWFFENMRFRLNLLMIENDNVEMENVDYVLI